MGFFDKKKTVKTTNVVNTTSITKIRDVGLTGAAAVDLARVSQDTAVYAIDSQAQQNLANTQLARDAIVEFGNTVNTGNRINAESFNNVVTQNSKNFTSLLGGATTLLDNAKSLSYKNLESSEKVGGDLIEGGKDLIGNVKQISDRLLPQTKELQNIAIAALVVAGGIVLFAGRKR